MDSIKTPPYSTTSLSDGSIEEKNHSDNYVKLPENEIVDSSCSKSSSIKDSFWHFKEFYIDAKCLDKYPEHKTPFRALIFLLFTMFFMSFLQSTGLVMNSHRLRKIEYALTQQKNNIDELYRTKYNFILDSLHECKIDSYVPPQEPTHTPDDLNNL